MDDMIIKVCGLREADNLAAVEQLDVDMVGFVFYPHSPRYVQMIRSHAGIIPDYSEERLAQLKVGKALQQPVENNGMCGNSVRRTIGSKPKRVGVFVDEMPQNIVTRVYNFSLDYVQLHGEETRETCENLRRTIDPDIRPGIGIIKALRITNAADVAQWRQYEGVVDLFLFDTCCPSVGGSGKQFDWSLLNAYDGPIPFLLSGGIGPDDVERIQAIRHPRFIGVDLNSKFETAPAVKDVNLLSCFVNKLRAFES